VVSHTRKAQRTKRPPFLSGRQCGWSVRTMVDVARRGRSRRVSTRNCEGRDLAPLMCFAIAHHPAPLHGDSRLDGGDEGEKRCQGTSDMRTGPRQVAGKPRTKFRSERRRVELAMTMACRGRGGCSGRGWASMDVIEGCKRRKTLQDISSKLRRPLLGKALRQSKLIRCRGSEEMPG
jgi:hypothetical protein